MKLVYQSKIQNLQNKEFVCFLLGGMVALVKPQFIN